MQLIRDKDAFCKEYSLHSDKYDDFMEHLELYLKLDLPVTPRPRITFFGADGYGMIAESFVNDCKSWQIGSVGLINDQKEFCGKYSLPEEEYEKYREEFFSYMHGPKPKARALDEYIEAAQPFPSEHRCTHVGSGPPAYYTKKFLPNDFEFVFTDEDEYKRAIGSMRITKEVLDITYGGDAYIKNLSYNDYKGFEVNLIPTSKTTPEEHVRAFDMECCKLIWDSTLSEPYSRTDSINIMAVNHNRITIEYHLVFNSNKRLKKYAERGFNVILVDPG
jgi:hypothetical protein